jgi:hypothetical protein
MIKTSQGGRALSGLEDASDCDQCDWATTLSLSDDNGTVSLGTASTPGLHQLCKGQAFYYAPFFEAVPAASIFPQLCLALAPRYTSNDCWGNM